MKQKNVEVSSPMPHFDQHLRRALSSSTPPAPGCALSPDFAILPVATDLYLHVIPGLWASRHADALKRHSEAIAVKTITVENISQTTFKKPGELLVQFDHPHIAKVRDAIADHRKFHVAKELFTGQPFLARMVQELSAGPVAEGMIAKRMSQSTRAIAYVHGLGYLHEGIDPDVLWFLNDIKDAPLNIIDLSLVEECSAAAWVSSPMPRRPGSFPITERESDAAPGKACSPFLADEIAVG